jgi:hypothetical protein
VLTRGALALKPHQSNSSCMLGQSLIQIVSPCSNAHWPNRTTRPHVGRYVQFAVFGERNHFTFAMEGCIVSDWLTLTSAARNIGLVTTSTSMTCERHFALPGFLRTAPSSAMWTANRLAGSLTLGFSVTR